MEVPTLLSSLSLARHPGCFINFVFSESAASESKGRSFFGFLNPPTVLFHLPLAQQLFSWLSPTKQEKSKRRRQIFLFYFSTISNERHDKFESFSVFE
jgi:hypothetical protein